MVEPTNYSSLGKCIKGDPKTVWVYVLGLFAPPLNACLQGKSGRFAAWGWIPMIFKERHMSSTCACSSLSRCFCISLGDFLWFSEALCTALSILLSFFTSKCPNWTKIWGALTGPFGWALLFAHHHPHHLHADVDVHHKGPCKVVFTVSCSGHFHKPWQAQCGTMVVVPPRQLLDVAVLLIIESSLGLS